VPEGVLAEGYVTASQMFGDDPNSDEMLQK
jgi:hypothetical protein